MSATLAAAGQQHPLALRHAKVFDTRSGSFQPNRTIVIGDGQIREIVEGGSGRVRGARVIDLRGQYVIPGLIDAHVHLVHQPDFAHMTPEELLPMYLAWGVTSLRDTGDEIVAETAARKWADANPGTCPRVFTCSPLLDADPPYHRDIGRAITDPAKVEETIGDIAAWGVTTLKIYVGTERAIGRSIITEGHKRGLVVAAHLGKYQAADAVADGVDVLEHIWSVFNYSFPEGARVPRHELDLSNPRASALRALIKQRGVMVNPTLAVFRNMILLNDDPAVNASPDHARVPKRLRHHWERYRMKANLQPATQAARRAEFAKYQELTGLLFQAGVPILAGTDSPEPYVPPGASLHQELEMLVASGLTPAEALKSATIINARALKQHERLGSIEPGKLADLVILGADPLADIRNTRTIRKVVKGGQVLDPARIHASVPIE
jgi:hypothetical protein